MAPPPVLQTTSPPPPAPSQIQVTPSPSDDKSLEGTVALVALVFAAIAFIATFLQALLQYLTSNQRDKCLKGAIGGWSKFSRTMWDLFTWRIRVYYPRLVLDPARILAARDTHRKLLANWASANIPQLLKGICRQRTYETSRKIRLANFWLVEDRGAMVHGPGKKAVRFWDLPFPVKIRWLWFWLIHRKRGEPPRAKAGWANFLSSFSVTPDDCLISGYNDADIIPSAVDVPIQTAKLEDICLMCYMAGIKDLTVIPNQGIINAENFYIKVSTQEVHGFGNVVTIDGDFDQLERMLTIADTTQLHQVRDMARGYLLGHTFDPAIEYFDENTFLFATVRKWGQDKWDIYRLKVASSRFQATGDAEDLRSEAIRTSPERQGTEYAKHKKQNPSKDWETTWHSIIKGHTPVLLKYLALMPFTSIWSAAPLRILIEPFYSHLDKQRKKWFELQERNSVNRSDRAFASYMPVLEQNSGIELALAWGSIPFLREASEFCIAGNGLSVLPESYTWAIYPNEATLQQWKSPLAQQVRQIQDPVIYLPYVVLRLLQGQCESISEAREWLQLSYSTSGLRYTLESAIFLAIFLVDCRLQAFLTVLETESHGQFYKFGAALKHIDNENPSEYLKKALIVKLLESIGWALEPLTADLIAFLFEIGKRVDLTGDSVALQDHLLQVLGDWENDEDPCILSVSAPNVPIEISEKLEDAVNTATEDNDEDARGEENLYRTEPASKSRKVFAQWVNSIGQDEKKRLHHIQEMMTIFQLRIFLMDLSYRCHADSSSVYLAKYERMPMVRLI